MKVRVLDFETSGVPTDTRKAICEVGYTDFDVETHEIGDPAGSLIDPGHPIPPETMAVHHIQDHDVVGCPSPAEACRMLMDGMGEDDLFAAHYAEFEQYFFRGAGRRWICTHKCAVHLWPEAPSHANQVLRYWLGFELDGRAMPPHRARPDSFVTAHILGRMLQCRSIDDLVAWTEGPAIQTKVTFGKHKGSHWRDLDRDYLLWLRDNATGLDADTMATVHYWLERSS
ncbi:MAG: hypothetical protein JJ902_05190 [Roseibium sp.]|nr:hypothetical protein [Roseibium sp.]